MGHHNKKRNQFRHPKQKGDHSHIAGQSPEQAKQAISIGKGSIKKKGGIRKWLSEKLH
jgi:hypothetical protein